MTVTTYTSNGSGGGAGFSLPSTTGNAGKLLTNDGAGNASWGGSYTLISSTSMVGSTTFTLSNIPQTYKHLYISVLNFGCGTANPLQWTFAGDTGSNYFWTYLQNAAGTTSNNNWGTPTTTMGTGNGWNGPTSKMEIMINDYATTDGFKTVKAQWIDGGYNYNGNGYGTWRNTLPVTSITMAQGYTITSGTMRIYGVN